MTRSIKRLASVYHDCLSVVYLLVCTHVYLFVCNLIALCVCVSVCLSFSVFVRVCLCVCLSVCLRVCLSIGQSGRDRSLTKSVIQFVCRTVDWSVCLCAYLRASVCLNLSITHYRECAGHEASDGLAGLHPVIVD